MAAVIDLALGLAAGWHVVPRADDPTWAAVLAHALVAPGAGGPSAGSGDGHAPGPEASLAADLDRVAASLDDAGSLGVRGAVLVRDPATGQADAMLALTVHRDVAPADYGRELRGLVDGALAAGAVHGAVFAAQVPGGLAQGAHLVHVQEDASVEGALPLLAERAVLGVFPDESSDMVELVLLPDSVSTFADVTVALTDLAQELRVTLGDEGAA